MESTAAETAEKFFKLTYKGEPVPENKSFEITGELGYYWAAVLTVHRARLPRPTKARISFKDFYYLGELMQASGIYLQIQEDGSIIWAGVTWYRDKDTAEGAINFD